jgi:hypothetical protein
MPPASELIAPRPWWALAFPPLLVFIAAIALAADLELLGFDATWFAGRDKPLHFALYGACGFAAVGWFHRHRAVPVIATVAGLVLLEELSQGLFATRSMDAADAIASIAGVIVGGAISARLRGGTPRGSRLLFTTERHEGSRSNNSERSNSSS